MKSVLFVQLPPSRFSFEEGPTNIPLAAGFLASALDERSRERFDSEILEPDIVDALADQGLLEEIVRRRPSIVAMTLYVWNVQRSLFLAANIKRRLPGVCVLVGGPEVTSDNLWVLKHPAADAGVFGEGESRIAVVVEALLDGKEPRGIPGIFFKDRLGIHVDSGRSAPWDLASCPYPYLNGKIGPSRDGTLFLETVRGCPFRCRYCYYHKAFTRVRAHPEESVERVLDVAYHSDSGVREIYLMDPTFNARKGFRRLLRSMARRRIRKDVAVHTELRADILSREDALLLKEAGLVSAEVGLQSINAKALRLAGRKGDPEKTARGVGLLKEAAIDVTTGIILGLPGDTPEEFRRTLTWLKTTGAYSVVHPFVLSVLPGTEFRARATAMGLRYDERPPYYVRSTRIFPEGAFRLALAECEQIFDMEIDYVPPPSLVDRGPGVVERPEKAPYISKWILDAARTDASDHSHTVFARATDPFTLWFRGNTSVVPENAIPKLLREFVDLNPHAVLRLIFEFPEPPPVSFLRKALDASASPGLFLNQSYRPLYGEEEVVSPTMTLVLTDPQNHEHRSGLTEEYESIAEIVWEVGEKVPAGQVQFQPPLLISGPMPGSRRHRTGLFQALMKMCGHQPDEVRFRDPSFQEVWDTMTGKPTLKGGLAETILLTI